MTSSRRDTIKSKYVKSAKERNIFFRLPFVRGVVNLVTQLFQGTGIIMRSAEVYGDFAEKEISKIFDNEAFGYTKITVERPLRDENGDPVLKKGKPQPDTALRDTENVPLTEDVNAYFSREVLPFAPDAWIDESKTKIGYEIPFTRYFYRYEPPRSSADIMAEILELEKELDGSLEEIFGV